MTSVLETSQIRYKGYQRDKKDREVITKIILVGSKDNLFNEMNATYKIGSTNRPPDITVNLGSLRSSKLSQAEGPFWELELEYSLDRGSGAASGTSSTPSESELNISELSMPIESHKDYKRFWTNNLYIDRTVWKNNPKHDWMLTDTIDIPADAHKGFFWATSLSECPTPQGNEKWETYVNMCKPGVTTYTIPTYTITEYSKHVSKDKAAWALSTKAGKISAPTKGDFGIVEAMRGNWLCNGGTITYNGRYWIATSTYTYAPYNIKKNKDYPYRGFNGWDTDLYDKD